MSRSVTRAAKKRSGVRLTSREREIVMAVADEVFNFPEWGCFALKRENEGLAKKYADFFAQPYGPGMIWESDGEPMAICRNEWRATALLLFAEVCR